VVFNEEFMFVKFTIHCCLFFTEFLGLSLNSWQEKKFGHILCTRKI